MRYFFALLALAFFSTASSANDTVYDCAVLDSFIDEKGVDSNVLIKANKDGLITQPANEVLLYQFTVERLKKVSSKLRNSKIKTELEQVLAALNVSQLGSAIDLYLRLSPVQACSFNEKKEDSSASDHLDLAKSMRVITDAATEAVVGVVNGFCKTTE